jgi:hypothetical protein
MKGRISFSIFIQIIKFLGDTLTLNSRIAILFHRTFFTIEKPAAFLSIWSSFIKNKIS